MALRAVQNVDSRVPTGRLHEQTGVNWLDVERKERCCIEAFRGIHNLSSTNVNNLSPVTAHVRNTRSNDSEICPTLQYNNVLGTVIYQIDANNTGGNCHRM